MASDNKIYLVIGEAGEYDSYSKWNVSAFLEQEKANTFKDKLVAFLVENGIPTDRSDSCRGDHNRDNPDDPYLGTLSGYGVEYSIEGLILRD
jgi:hypothetical protein